MVGPSPSSPSYLLFLKATPLCHCSHFWDFAVLPTLCTPPCSSELSWDWFPLMRSGPFPRKPLEEDFTMFSLPPWCFLPKSSASEPSATTLKDVLEQQVWMNILGEETPPAGIWIQVFLWVKQGNQQTFGMICLEAHWSTFKTQLHRFRLSS